MTTYSDDDLTKAGRAALTKVPWAIRRGLGDENTIVFKNKSDKNGVAEVEPGTRIVYIDDPKKFMFSPRQVVAHEATHILQSRLHPTAQAKFPKTNDQNPYGQMNSPNAHLVLQQARQNGKTISDFSREEQGAIVQHYAALQQGLEDAVTSKTLTPDLKNRFNQTLQIYQPYIDDYAKLPMAINEPTSKSQKGINTAPQAPPGPDPSLMHTDVILNTQPPRSSMPLPPNPDASNVVTAPPSPQPQTTSPDMSSATIPQQPQTQFTPPAQAAGMGGPPQITPQLAQNAAIGAAHKSLGQLLMGSSTSYVQTPNGPVPVQTQNKPGQFFRNVLASAIMGGAAGGETNMRDSAGSGWGAAARGAGAARAGFQQQDQQAQQQAQQQFQNQQSAAKEQREETNEERQKTLNEAQIAMWHQEILSSQNTIDHQKREDLEKHSEANRALYKTLQDRGGVEPTDPGVPATISAYDLMNKYNETKGAVAHPVNKDTSRIFIDTSKHETIQQDAAGNWVDEDGNPEDMTKHTELRVLDIPTKTLDTKQPISNKEIMKQAGHSFGLDPNGTSMVSGRELLGLATQRRAEATERGKQAGIARANELETLKQNKDKYDAAQGRVTEENRGLNEQLEKISSPQDPQYAQIQGQIAANNKWLDQQYEAAYGVKPGPEGAAKTGPPVKAPPITDPRVQASIAAIKDLPPSAQEAWLLDANIPEATKKVIRQGVKKATNATAKGSPDEQIMVSYPSGAKKGKTEVMTRKQYDWLHTDRSLTPESEKPVIDQSYNTPTSAVGGIPK